MTNHAASINFADASNNLVPDLPTLPPGWIWAAAACGGNYRAIPDIGIRCEMLRLTNGAADFQKAFREVWGMPYVVIPAPKS